MGDKHIYSMILASALIGPVFAQQPSGSEIKAREENQQDRIGNGIASGQLTAGEAARLETKAPGLAHRRVNVLTTQSAMLTM